MKTVKLKIVVNGHAVWKDTFDVELLVRVLKHAHSINRVALSEITDDAIWKTLRRHARRIKFAMLDVVRRENALIVSEFRERPEEIQRIIAELSSRDSTKTIRDFIKHENEIEGQAPANC